MIENLQRKRLIPVCAASAALLLATLSATTPATARSPATLITDLTVGANQTVPLVHVQQNEDSQATFIRDIQRHLATLGLYEGAIDGNAGQGTWAGVRRFCEEAQRDCRQNFNGEDLRALAQAARAAAPAGGGVASGDTAGRDGGVRLFNLAAEAYTVDDYHRAELLYRQALAVFEQALGSEHPDTLSSRNNLANALRAQGRYAEAEALHRETLAIRERLHSAEHTDTLASRNNLADTLRAQLLFDEAEILYRQTLSIRERVFGVEHPDSLQTRRGLGSALWGLGQFAEAEALQRETLGVQSRHLVDRIDDETIRV